MIRIVNKTLLERFPNRELTSKIRSGELVPSCIYLVGNNTLDIQLLFENRKGKRHSFRASWTYSVYRSQPINYTHWKIDVDGLNRTPVNTKSARVWMDSIEKVRSTYSMKPVQSKPPSVGERIESLSFLELEQIEYSTNRRGRYSPTYNYSPLDYF